MPYIYDIVSARSGKSLERFYIPMKALTWITEQAVAVFFTATLFLLLFVGEGKHSIVDLVGLAGILSLSFVSIYTKKVSPPERGISLSWSLLLLYLGIVLPFSDSFGFSLYASLRYVLAFLVFSIFSSTSVSLLIYKKCLFAVIVFAVLVSLFLPALVSWRGWIPEMNMIYKTYGHHHVAFVILFGLPFILPGPGKRFTLYQGVVAVVLFGFLLGTWARGACLVGALYFSYRVFRGVKPGKIRWVLVGAVLLLMLFVLMVTVVQKQGYGLSVYAPKKSQSILEPRLSYWTQGVKAITIKPFFGSGLGTFSIQSLRHQERPLTYSWFAHSFIVQTVVEIGFMGLALLFFLFATFYRSSQRAHANAELRPVVDAVVITFLYSLIEFNLDYMIVWLLLWSALGVIVSGSRSHQSVSAKKTGKNNLFLLVFGIALASYSLFVISEVAQYAVRSFGRSEFFLPYNSQRSLLYLDSLEGRAEISDESIQRVLFFHGNNSEVLFAAADLYKKKREDLALSLYRRALANDPQRSSYLTVYLAHLSETQQGSVGNEVLAVIFLGMPKALRPQVMALEDSSEAIDESFRQVYSDAIPPLNEGYVSLLYQLGLVLLNSRPDLTERLWILARDAYPDLAHGHIELASYYLFIAKDEQRAQEILTHCQRYISAKAQCEAQEIWLLGEPGWYKDIFK